jgi:archaellum biogenesis ATPase FlaH
MNLKFKGKETYSERPFRKGPIVCPVCGEKSRYHCRVREDDTLAICKNEPNDKPTKDGKGYIYILDNSNGQGKKASKAVQKAAPDIPKADADRLNEVYTALLNSLKLKDLHFDNLVNKRGLTEQKLTENLYKSVPSYEKGLEVVETLAKSFDLEGIPGFYFSNGKWVLRLTYPGFYVPYRDEQGRIVGLQIRQDKDGQPKYIWLSSKDKERGTSSGTPLHFVNPETVRETKEIFITEGALKADIIGELHNVGVMAMGGVNVLKADNLVAALDNTFPSVERIVLAFDMDWEINDEVKDALSKLVEALRQKYLSVFVLTWDRNVGKGMDDVLFKIHTGEIPAENSFTIVKAEEFQAKFLAEEIEDNGETSNQETESMDVIEEDKLEQTENDMNDESRDIIETFAANWGDFSKITYPKPERIVFGLNRGNIGLLNASTNVGKTTLILNLALSAASNRLFEPFVGEETVGRKILYIDGEATKPELQADIKKMSENLSLEQRKLLDRNLSLICDEEVDNEPLNLVKSSHRKKVLEKAKEFQADLIIVDTLSALTLMEDENDNAKVNAEIIQPLKNMAKKANAAVLILHHTGKWNEGSSQSVAGAYKGRGASAFGAMTRSTFYLRAIAGNKVELSCPKVKGAAFNDVILELDANSRWFKVIGVNSETKKTKTDAKYETVVSFVSDQFIKTGKPIKRDEIINALKGQVSKTTVGRKLDKAVEEGDLTQPKYGYYSVTLNPGTEVALAE